jgi:hypothetical protein
MYIHVVVCTYMYCMSTVCTDVNKTGNVSKSTVIFA